MGFRFSFWIFVDTSVVVANSQDMPGSNNVENEFEILAQFNDLINVK